MKKLILFFTVFTVILCGVAFADDVVEPVSDTSSELSIGDTLKKIPMIRRGVAYDIEKDEVAYFATAEVFKYDKIELSPSVEIGILGNDTIVGAITIGVVELKELGVSIPILNLINVRAGYMVGIDKEEEITHGPCITFIDAKF